MNIHKTNPELLKTEIKNLRDKLEKNVADYILEKTCPHLFKTSPTLFKMIVKNYKDPNLDVKIDQMLELILKIQNKTLSQHEASEIIGTNLAKEYINVCKDL